MSRWIKVDEDINQYINDHLAPEQPVLQELHKKTSLMKGAGMQISNEQPQIMSAWYKAIRRQTSLRMGV